MIFSNRELQLPAPDLRQVVADAVPPLGHDERRARLRRHPEARACGSDMYLEAMKELGVAVKVAEEQKITLFDGVFDGKDPDKYATFVPDPQHRGSTT